MTGRTNGVVNRVSIIRQAVSAGSLALTAGRVTRIWINIVLATGQKEERDDRDGVKYAYVYLVRLRFDRVSHFGG